MRRTTVPGTPVIRRVRRCDVVQGIVNAQEKAPLILLLFALVVSIATGVVGFILALLLGV